MSIEFPKISIVMPSFNQGLYLERAIRSVLDQNYPKVELVVMDGGSTDGSVEIIKRYSDRLRYWISQKDGGQYAAITEGFKHTTGEVLAYLNSDDMYMPWAFHTVGTLFAEANYIEWLTTAYPMGINKQDQLIGIYPLYGFTKSGFMRGENLLLCGWPGTGFIQQEATFWTRSLWDRAGGKFDETLKYAGDFELWARFYQWGTLFAVDIPLAGFRFHGEQKTAFALKEYLEEAQKVFFKVGGKKPNRLWQFLRLFLHSSTFPKLRTFLINRKLLSPAYVFTNDARNDRWWLNHK